jgi:two-component system, sensor histidine kinase and response regulator
VRSTPGIGSTFGFSVHLQYCGDPEMSPTALPLVATPFLPGASSADQLRQHHGTAGILLVEDHPVNQMLVTELLDMVGLHADVACDGIQAVDMTNQRRYDLILMDVQMPGMDGLQATRLIRQQGLNTRTPIVAMSASVMAAERQACLSAGMADHLGKPVDPHVLYDMMLHWLNQTRTVQALED